MRSAYCALRLVRIHPAQFVKLIAPYGALPCHMSRQRCARRALPLRLANDTPRDRTGVSVRRNSRSSLRPTDPQFTIHDSLSRCRGILTPAARARPLAHFPVLRGTCASMCIAQLLQNQTRAVCPEQNPTTNRRKAHSTPEIGAAYLCGEGYQPEALSRPATNSRRTSRVISRAFD